MKNKPSSNIPYRKRVESKQTDPNSLLSAIIESPRDIVIFALDRNYCYTAFNKSHKQTIKNIWGADIEIGMNILKIIKDPKDRKKAKKNFDRALKGESFTLIEKYGESSHRFYYEDAYSPVFDDAGKVTGLSLFLTDITEKKRTEDELDKYRNQLEDIVKQRTRALEKAKEKLEFDIHERKQAEEALRESEAKYKEIATSIPGVVYQFIVKKDGSYAFSYIDESCEKFFQHKAKAVVADPNLFFNMVPPDERQSFFDSIEKSAKTLKEWRHDFRVVLPDGQECWFEGRSIPHLLPSGEPFWNGVVTDVTEHKRAEEKIKQQSAQRRILLEMGRQITSSLEIDAVLKNISKEIRTLLDCNGITIYMLDKQSKMLTPVLSYDPPYDKQVMTAKLDIDTCLTGQAIKAMQGIIFNYANQQPGSFQIPGTPVDDDDHIISVPFIIDGRAIGALTIYRKLKIFTEEDQSLVEIFAMYASTAINNAQVYEELQNQIAERKLVDKKLTESLRELNLLDQINKAALGGESIEKIIDRIVHVFTELCHAKSLTIYFYEKEQHRLVSKNLEINQTTAHEIEKLAGIKLKNFAPKLKKGYRFTRALKSGKGFILSNHKEIAELYTEFTDNKTLKKLIKPIIKFIEINNVGVFPLMAHKEPIGLITFNTEFQFSKQGIDRIQRFSQQVASTLEKARAKDALAKSEERYRSILENIDEGYYEVDLKGNFTFFNDSICRMLNYSRDELMGINNRQYMDTESADKVYQAFNEVFKTGKSSTTIDFKIKRKEGNINAGEISISLLKDRNNQPIGFRGIVRDITERKLAEQALRESEEKFRGVIEQSNDGIYVLQGDRFVFINPRYTEITGYQLEEISAEDFDFKKLVTKEGLKILEEREAKHKRGEEVPSRYIFKGLRKDGQKQDLEVSVATVEWQGKPATLGVLRDVTERIKTRTKLEEALEDAKQANSVKSLFMANMSHEIRTPLNAILGFTDLIEASTRHLVSEEEQEFFDTVRDSGNRLMDTVHEILDISQIEAGTYDLKQEHIDLVILVRNMIRECQSMADKKGIKIEYSFEIDSAFIKADQYSMSQAICNIIDNAIKYTKQGKISVSIEQKAKQYVLSIQDTGIGIAEEYIEDLYNAFSQESEGYTKKYQGIGLGMAITKRHLDLNNVDINVESIKGVGTTFSLIFKPVKKKSLYKKKQIKQKEVKDKPTADVVDKSLILLVEDDTGFQKLTEFFLKKKYDICFAVSVGEAKQQLKKYPVDLILLDLSLIGNEDGLDLVRWMRKSKTWKKTPVIATTAHAFTTDQNNCITAGCNDYLPKPIKREKLLEKISEFVC